MTFWRYALILVFLGMGSRASQAQQDPAVPLATVLGNQMHALRAKDYATYMSYFLPTCTYWIRGTSTAAQWQEVIAQEIGDATVTRVTLSAWAGYRQFITLKTPEGERKIIVMEVGYTVTPTPAGWRISKANLRTLRSTLTGPYTDERPLMGTWQPPRIEDAATGTAPTHPVNPAYQDDIEFARDGTVTFRPHPGRASSQASVVGRFHQVDRRHLQIFAPGLPQEWTITYMTPVGKELQDWNAQKERLVRAGVPEDVLTPYPINYYIMLTGPEGLRLYIER